MQDFVGIHKAHSDDIDASEMVRRMRRGSRLERVHER